MTDLSALLERVRKATGPDRELDGEIAATLRVGNNLPDWAQNWTGEWRPTIQGFVVLIQDDERPGPDFSSPKFTASIDDALALAERVLPGATRAVDATAPELGIDVDLFVGSGEFRGTSLSEPIATITALLSALIAQKAAG